MREEIESKRNIFIQSFKERESKNVFGEKNLQFFSKNKENEVLY